VTQTTLVLAETTTRPITTTTPLALESVTIIPTPTQNTATPTPLPDGLLDTTKLVYEQSAAKATKTIAEKVVSKWENSKYDVVGGILGIGISGLLWYYFLYEERRYVPLPRSEPTIIILNQHHHAEPPRSS